MLGVFVVLFLFEDDLDVVGMVVDGVEVLM